MSDDDRERIVDRLRLESEVRKQLESEAVGIKKDRWAWMESKLGLLLIGAVLTGILIPLFQATQETIRWTRQNRYDNLKYRLESTRSAMRELTLTHTFVAEAYERTKAVVGKSSTTKEKQANYESQVLEMQNRRFQQNAKFIGTLALLDETAREPIRLAFNDYLSSVQQYMQVLEAPRSVTGDRREEALVSLAKDVDANYEQTLEMLKNYLRELEVQSEKYY